MPPPPPTILLLGTCDTKLPELLYTQTRLETHGCTVLILDIGRAPTSSPAINIPQSSLLDRAPPDPSHDVSRLPRAEYIATLTPLACNRAQELQRSGTIHGVLGIGGSCGTAVAAAVMRGLPIGFPKMMVSTMASGDVAPYIGESDIAMMYSVVDIAGRNRVLERVLGNAAAAVAGMGKGFWEGLIEGEKGGKDEPVKIGVSMFGVTTPAVMAASERLKEGIPGVEIYTFHATGSGGRAMERLIEEGQLDAVLDLTTTEIADEVVGGVLSAGQDRLVAATKRDIPRVVSVGACDMVNFGTPDSVPAHFTAKNEGQKERQFHHHNPTVTLMRTTKEEVRDIAKLIAKNILGEGGTSSSVSKTKVILPIGGVSMLDVPGQSFWDAEVDEVLFSTLEGELKGSKITVERDTRDINDPGFANAAADQLRSLLGL